MQTLLDEMLHRLMKAHRNKNHQLNAEDVFDEQDLLESLVDEVFYCKSRLMLPDQTVQQRLFSVIGNIYMVLGSAHIH